VGFKRSLPEKKNVTMSFNPVTMECHGCPVHHAKQMWRPKGSREAANLQGEAFLLTDQAYPPMFPVEKQNCMKIVRREHGTLLELANELLAMTKGMEVGKQTVVLMHSLSHMARAGMEGYIEDLLMAASKIKAVLGQHVAVIPHLFEAGCRSEMAIRTVAEVTTWASMVYGNDGLYLGRTFEIANELLAPKMGAEVQVDYERTLRLPTTPRWPATRATWVMGSFKLARAIKPVSVAMEASLILSLIEELRKGLALELDVDPTFDRLAPAMVASDKSVVDYLVIGRSGPVAMMAEALMRKGPTVNRADAAEWRINKSFVGHLAELTKAAMAEAKPKVVVVIGIEESYFRAQFEVGYTSPATKDSAGRHHINGELVVANADTQQRFLQAMDPIWTATSGTITVVVSPMARYSYLTKGCCEEPGHITNRVDPNFATQMKADLLAAKYKMKRFFMENGHPHCIVMYPAKDLEDEDLSKIWGEDDPTLPLPSVFDKMVVAVKSAEERADITGAKRAGGGQDGPPTKKARLDTGNDGQATGNPAPEGRKRGTKGKKAGGGRGSGGGRGGDGGGSRGGGGSSGPGGTRGRGSFGAANLNRWKQPGISTEQATGFGRGSQRRGGGGGGPHSSGGPGPSDSYGYQDWRYDDRNAGYWPPDGDRRGRGGGGWRGGGGGSGGVGSLGGRRGGAGGMAEITVADALAPEDRVWFVGSNLNPNLFIVWSFFSFSFFSNLSTIYVYNSF
jgi:uncharacterized membrane protein YgcG